MPFNVTIESPLSAEETLSNSDASFLSAQPSEAHPEHQDSPAGLTVERFRHVPYSEDPKPVITARRRRSYERSRFRSRSRSWPRVRITRTRSSPRSRSSSVSSSSPNCLFNSGENDRDITIHLDLDAALDISEDLERLARLNRRGHFSQAITLFHKRLASHVDFFPVVAEYADLLLEQGSFGQLRQFISSRLLDTSVTFADEEVLLLKLLKSVAEIYTNGALIPALEMTLETLKHLAHRSRELSTWFKPPTGVQIQLIEACLRVITYAAAHSSFLENDPFRVLLRWTFSNDRLTLNSNRSTFFYPPSAYYISDNSEPGRTTSHRRWPSAQDKRAAVGHRSPSELNVTTLELVTGIDSWCKNGFGGNRINSCGSRYLCWGILTGHTLPMAALKSLLRPMTRLADPIHKSISDLPNPHFGLDEG